MGPSARPFGPRHSPLSAPLHENTPQMLARPCGPRLSSVGNAPGANFSPPRRPPRRLGHAALDSDHAEYSNGKSCMEAVLSAEPADDVECIICSEAADAVKSSVNVDMQRATHSYHHPLFSVFTQSLDAC